MIGMGYDIYTTDIYITIVHIMIVQ